MSTPDQDDLACPALLTATRFVPFGYKEVTFSQGMNPAVSLPARIMWRIPERFSSLSQIKFATSPSKGMGDVVHRSAGTHLGSLLPKHSLPSSSSFLSLAAPL